MSDTKHSHAEIYNNDNSISENDHIKKTEMYCISYVNNEGEENHVYVSTPDGPQAAFDLVVEDVLLTAAHGRDDQKPMSDDALAEIEAFDRLEWEFDSEIAINRFEPSNEGVTEFARLEYCEVSESDPVRILKRLGLIK